MKKLTINQKRNIVGGKGITGALLTGVAKIIEAFKNSIVDVIGAVSTCVQAKRNFTTAQKIDYKIGNSSLKYEKVAPSAKPSKKTEPAPAPIVPLGSSDILDLF